jgi:hypothetical protein
MGRYVAAHLVRLAGATAPRPARLPVALPNRAADAATTRA